VCFRQETFISREKMTIFELSVLLVIAMICLCFGKPLDGKKNKLEASVNGKCF
jgi:hypothetical protein